MTPLLRDAVPADIPVLLRLTRALADHEGQPERVTATEDDLRRAFFGAPPAAAAPQVDLTLRWKAGTDMAAAAQLLRSAGASVVGGPDAAGTWSLHLLHPAEGRRVLESSPLVEAVGPP